MLRSIAPGLLAVMFMVHPVSAAKITDAQKLRQEAEHLCYDDVQKLCSDVVSDEGKVKSCMSAHHGQLSPACREVYDKGMKAAK